MLIALLYAQWAASYACAMPTSALGRGLGEREHGRHGLPGGAERSTCCAFFTAMDPGVESSGSRSFDLAIGVPVIVPWAVAALPMAAMPAERGTSDVPRQTSPPPLLLTRRFRN
ncbi:MAG: hypothetical protein U1F52_18310 [Burkholderiales bacterium]